jgi:hypothetical protein
VLGEHLLLQAVPRDQLGEAMYALLFALVDHLDLSDEQVDQLVASAEEACSRLCRVRSEYLTASVSALPANSSDDRPS